MQWNTGGLIACVDDFFVKRTGGIGTSALIEARTLCEKAGIRALTVEVGPDNTPARTIYRRVGFAETVRRQLLALLLPPMHL
jgi:hypothetical protein